REVVGRDFERVAGRRARVYGLGEGRAKAKIGAAKHAGVAGIVASERPVIGGRIESRACADERNFAGSGGGAGARTDTDSDGDVGDAILIEIANGGRREELQPAAVAGGELPGS